MSEDDLVLRMRRACSLSASLRLLDEGADEIERLRADAARYRFLRQNRTEFSEIVLAFTGTWPETEDDADAAIDAALGEKRDAD